MQSRELRIKLMQTYRHRGQLLAPISRHVNLADDERDCIALHEQWEFFVEAERWNHTLGRRGPTTATSALQLIGRWRNAGSPSVSQATRFDATEWVIRQQVKLGLLCVFQWALDTGLSAAPDVLAYTELLAYT
jgi:hypothetical protein